MSERLPMAIFFFFFALYVTQDGNKMEKTERTESEQTPEIEPKTLPGQGRTWHVPRSAVPPGHSPHRQVKSTPAV